MAWIRIIDENDADGELEEIYREIISARGKLSNVMRVHSLHPKAMREHMNLYRAIMFGENSLPRCLCEIIAVVVSSANGCKYCIRHHAEALDAYWKDSRRIDLLAEDYRSAGLDDRETAICEYAQNLTRNPGNASEQSIKALSEQGLSDDEILTITLIAAYFNFVNRIVLGLGVEFTPDEAQGYRY
ncbi:MAG TPA: peroxidase [candidate division Zixibacteria bacterium]|nr:peroxidase [candidate division Zixibacteria bacterium]